MTTAGTLPPSAPFVRTVLQDADGGLTTPELADRTGLPKLTVREADTAATDPSDPENPVALIHCLTETHRPEKTDV